MAGRSIEELEREFESLTSSEDTQQVHALLEELVLHDSRSAEALREMILGDLDVDQGRDREALQRYTRAMDQYAATGRTRGIALLSSRIGQCLYRQGEYNAALEHYQRALELLTDVQDKERCASLNANIGVTFMLLADFSTCLEYLLRALAMFQELGSLKGQARTLSYIANMYIRIDDFTLALEYLRRALAINIELGNDAGRANVFGNIGIAYAHLNDLGEATRWLTNAVDLARTVGLVREQGYYVNALAEIALNRGDLDGALAILDANAEVIAQTPTPATFALVTRGKVARARGDLDAAVQFIEQALQQVELRGEKLHVAEFHQLLRDMAKERGDFEAYIRHNELHQSITEQIKGGASTRRFTMQEKERELEVERRAREREREILYGALPQHVADRLIRGEAIADSFASASVMFLDLAGFTRISSMIPPTHVVHLLESIFSVCDEIVQRHGITKIKTIGDSYMAVAGVPVKQDDHVDRMARAATEIQCALEDMQLTMPPELGDTSWLKEIDEVHARVGVHCGPVVAGVVGKERLQYDVWGDAVNVASRMESSGEPGRVHASEDFITALSDHTQWNIEPRAAVEIKGKGLMQTYWLRTR